MAASAFFAFCFFFFSFSFCGLLGNVFIVYETPDGMVVIVSLRDKSRPKALCTDNRVFARAVRGYIASGRGVGSRATHRQVRDEEEETQKTTPEGKKKASPILHTSYLHTSTELWVPTLILRRRLASCAALI
jgi:hypothetical protein